MTPRVPIKTTYLSGLDAGVQITYNARHIANTGTKKFNVNKNIIQTNVLYTIENRKWNEYINLKFMVGVDLNHHSRGSSSCVWKFLIGSTPENSDCVEHVLDVTYSQHNFVENWFWWWLTKWLCDLKSQMTPGQNTAMPTPFFSTFSDLMDWTSLLSIFASLCVNF